MVSPIRTVKSERAVAQRQKALLRKLMANPREARKFLIEAKVIDKHGKLRKLCV